MRARVFIILPMALWLSVPSLAENPTVKAQILKANPRFTSYTPLCEAKVTILKDGRRFHVKTVDANSEGFVNFEVPVSTPFSLVFHGGGNRVPRMVSLAGKSGSDNVLHVCLHTKREYFKRYDDAAGKMIKAEINVIMLEIERIRSVIGRTERKDELRQLNDLKKMLDSLRYRSEESQNSNLK